MIDRQDGGQLVVNPPRRVWERTALEPAELTRWTVLVASTGRAMLECLPQLDGGCLNYWDAGNWALHHDAEPVGPKRGAEHRFLHQHVIGRSPRATDPSWRWGEAPIYPSFADRFRWSEGKRALTPAECADIVTRLEHVLRSVYRAPAAEIVPWSVCGRCAYPAPTPLTGSQSDPCATCRASTLQSR